MKRYSLTILLISLLISCTNANKDIEHPIKINSVAKESPLFERIEASISGIDFSNTITHDVNTNENLFDYDYFYNGAGVGIEDLNNDGLPDLFFCGNQVANKLFLNKGALQFEDVTISSAINKCKEWSNGVTFVDINNDGWKDIYISQGGPNTRDNRKNLLLVNQKDATFIEQAEEYGLADMGISTQSAFFDMDKDGDLDCIVMNENELYGVDPINLYRIIEQNPETKYFNSSHLYRNDDGKFVDITEKAGLLRPIFGLGLSVSDINNDGWLDIYLTSDYYIPDALFINNKNGTFTDKVKEYTNHISYYGMGMDIADINNDSQQDIFVLDMAANDHVRSKTLMASMNTNRFDYLVNKAKFHHQYMYNSLQLNIGNDKFNNIAQLSKIANTDWSWSVLMSDFNNDEFKDIYITNGYRRYALDNDLQGKVRAAKKKYRNNVPMEVKSSLYESMPSEKLPNIMYENKQNLKFENVATDWGLGDFSFSNGAAVGDLDNDGDLDLVVNNIDEKSFLYQNFSSDRNLGNYLKVRTISSNSESFAKIKITYNGKSQFVENKRVRGYMSSHDNIAHFGLGKESSVDTVSITWPNGRVEEKYNVKANTTLDFLVENSVPILPKTTIKSKFKKVNPEKFNLDFTHKENYYDDFETEILLPYKQSNFGPSISKGDVNQDGKIDVFIGGASGQAGQLYLQSNNGFSKKSSETFQNDKNYEDIESIFFDFDSDNDLDLYVVSGGNEFAENSSYYADRLYLNDGKGNFTRFDSDILNSNPKSGKTVAAIDFDKDGDYDLLVGNRMIPKNYPKYSSSILYENVDGQLKNVTSKKAFELENFGLINSIIATDFNNDGWTDFIAVGEWSTIGVFENKKGAFFNISATTKSLQKKGWWFSVHETDVNNDGLKDYILGNAGLNLKFKASSEKPFKVFANDFDNDGTNDIILSKKYNGAYVPVRGRECSSQQMPFIKNKFSTYSDYANANLSDIYGDKLKDSYYAEATEFRSVLLLNKGNGEFKETILPIEAQSFPILDCVFYDINADGYEDCIIAGNIYETEVETPRLDAISGLILISNGKDGYSTMPQSKSGLYLKGNVKSLALIPFKNQELLITGKNNAQISAFSLKVE